MVNMICPERPLLMTAMVLLKAPGLPLESKEAITYPVLPGIMGSLVQLGVVQPQEG